MIHYHTPAGHHDYFYPRALRSVVKKIEQCHPHADQVTIEIHPDAMFKSNLMPTGILVESTLQNTLLMPFLLRDPGCGFNCFTLQFANQPQDGWQHQAGPALDRLLNNKKEMNALASSQAIQRLSIQDILYHGLDCLNLTKDERHAFCDTAFTVDQHCVQPSQQQCDALSSDLFELTNTMEIRKPVTPDTASMAAKIDMNGIDYIGFVHAGCRLFPKILTEQFLQPICDYAVDHRLASIPMIQQGLVGVPLLSDIGSHYFEWLKAAMNYALVSRYGIFKAVQHYFQCQLDCDVVMINDRIHAGITIDESQQPSLVRSFRGVQKINPLSECHLPSIGLLAGDRETDAILVSSFDNQSHSECWFSHGCNGNVYADFDYAQHFSSKDRDSQLTQAKSAFYNTPPQYHECLPRTYNLNVAMTHFEQQKRLKAIARLQPKINIFGRALAQSY